jgi:ubiquinone/menaquinone biosynthesis C-methylase UbiE
VVSVDRIRSAYAARARDYIDFIASSGAASAGLDQDLIGRWAEQISGPVVDAGCGPGHWTQFLRERGLVVEGVDIVPEFLAHAATRYPDATFRPARLDDLRVEDASLGALLSWFSIIHTAPADVPAVLAEFARCVRPGGSLLLGFCAGARLEPFDHAVVTAYFWPAEAMRSALDAVGFDVVETQRRTDPGTRPQAAMIARRRDPAATPVTAPAG